jgi:AbiJ N-terminal domain 3
VVLLADSAVQISIPQAFPPELRERLLRLAKRNRFSWTARISYVDFYKQILDLEALPSTDSRHDSALGDMWQHTMNNDDWDEDYILDDARFSPLKMTDDQFGKLIRLAFGIDAHTEEELEAFGTIIKPVVECLAKLSSAATSMGSTRAWTSETAEAAQTTRVARIPPIPPRSNMLACASGLNRRSNCSRHL